MRQWTNFFNRLFSKVPRENSLFLDAVRNGDAKEARKLIEMGADINVTDEWGSPAIMVAIANGHASTAKMLINMGCDISLEYGSALLHEASLSGLTEIVSILIERGVNINATDGLGRTALMKAIWMSRRGPLHLLVEKGANITVTDDEGRTAFTLASEMQYDSEILKLLTPQGNAADSGTFQVLDFRSDKEKAIAAEGSRGEGVSQEVHSLLSALNDARVWGRANGWPVYDQYPQYQTIRSIGTSIDQQGGREAMQRAYYYIESCDRELASMLGNLWDGVGRWMA